MRRKQPMTQKRKKKKQNTQVKLMHINRLEEEKQGVRGGAPSIKRRLKLQKETAGGTDGLDFLHARSRSRRGCSVTGIAETSSCAKSSRWKKEHSSRVNFPSFSLETPPPQPPPSHLPPEEAIFAKKKKGWPHYSNRKRRTAGQEDINQPAAATSSRRSAAAAGRPVRFLSHYINTAIKMEGSHPEGTLSAPRSTSICSSTLKYDTLW